MPNLDSTRLNGCTNGALYGLGPAEWTNKEISRMVLDPHELRRWSAAVVDDIEPVITTQIAGARPFVVRNFNLALPTRPFTSMQRC